MTSDRASEVPRRRSSDPAPGTASRTSSPAGWVWLLSRPLAADEHRARFWVRHVQIGVVLTELAVLMVLVYAVCAHRPRASVLVPLAVAVMLAAPALLALPMHRLCRDHRGALVFYAWSAASTLLIATAALLDGGASSPLTWLLVLTLTYAGVAYPPLGVSIMGAFMIGAYLALVALTPASLAHTAVTSAVLVLFTVMIGWVSNNQWDMSDQQVMLLQRLATLADTDDLTSLLNRRAFNARLDSALASADARQPLSLCVVDLDGFKAVNDTHGHATGDRLLVDIGRALLAGSRETDSVTRLGGDEFAILLPATSSSDAAVTGARLHARLSAVGALHGVTASIGIVTAVSPGTGDDLMAWADRVMYEAKTTGRNRVTQHQ